MSSSDEEEGDEAVYESTEEQDERNPPADESRKRKRRQLNPDEIVWDRPDKEAYKGPQVNWSALAGRKWAKEPLLKYLPHPEISNLIGWAHYGTNNGTTVNDWEQGDPLKTKAKAKPQPPNPLLEIEPDGPLPTSHLAFLQDKAKVMVQGKPENPNISKAKVMEESLECILESFDTSASVALGMVLEEMITANLLPLAEAHVQRCRQLEQQEEQLKPVSPRPENPSFQEWTLPPEEAIFNIITSSLTSDSSGNLPSACPPTRSILANMPQGEDTGQEAAAKFCKRHDLKSRFVQKNMDIYKWFLPTAPPDVGDNMLKKKRKLRIKKERYL